MTGHVRKNVFCSQRSRLYLTCGIDFYCFLSDSAHQDAPIEVDFVKFPEHLKKNILKRQKGKAIDLVVSILFSAVLNLSR